ncbi:MAG: hypothetical protein ACLQEQ_05570 [Nitrososphaerales archaeon]
MKATAWAVVRVATGFAGAGKARSSGRASNITATPTTISHGFMA